MCFHSPTTFPDIRLWLIPKYSKAKRQLKSESRNLIYDEWSKLIPIDLLRDLFTKKYFGQRNKNGTRMNIILDEYHTYR